MKVVKVIFEHEHEAGFTHRKEIIDDSEYGGTGELELEWCFTPSGDYIGTVAEAKFLCIKKGLTLLQTTDPSHCVCSIGFNKKEQKWYGWSHRAICGFGKEDDHDAKEIKTMEDAKLAARRFAKSVS